MANYTLRSVSRAVAVAVTLGAGLCLVFVLISETQATYKCLKIDAYPWLTPVEGGYEGLMRLENQQADSTTILGIGRVDCPRCSIASDLPIQLQSKKVTVVKLFFASVPSSKIPIAIYCDNKHASTTVELEFELKGTSQSSTTTQP